MLWVVGETLTAVGSHICGGTEWLQSRELGNSAVIHFGA